MRNEWRCVTSPTVQHKIFISIVIGRGFSCTTRIYGPHLQVSKMHPYTWAVNTARIRVLGTLPIYMGRTAEKHCKQCFFVRAIYTGRIYEWPVRTTRTYGPYIRAVCTGVKNAPVCTGRKYGPYIRALGTHYLYRWTVQLKRIAVLYEPYTGDRYALPVNMGHKYGPYVRVSKMHPHVWAVHTARIYGPYSTGHIYG